MTQNSRYEDEQFCEKFIKGLIAYNLCRRNARLRLDSLGTRCVNK